MAAACVAVVMAQPANAASWKFELINKSAAHVTSFRTQEDGQWSDNWLEENVAPGETFDMDFGTDEGDCEVTTRLEFTDQTYVEAPIDYCKANIITLRNNDVTWK